MANCRRKVRLESLTYVWHVIYRPLIRVNGQAPDGLNQDSRRCGGPGKKSSLFLCFKLRGGRILT